jgi:hypothetical protein
MRRPRIKLLSLRGQRPPLPDQRVCRAARPCHVKVGSDEGAMARSNEDEEARDRVPSRHTPEIVEIPPQFLCPPNQ